MSFRQIGVLCIWQIRDFTSFQLWVGTFDWLVGWCAAASLAQRLYERSLTHTFGFLIFSAPTSLHFPTPLWPWTCRNMTRSGYTTETRWSRILVFGFRGRSRRFASMIRNDLDDTGRHVPWAPNGVLPVDGKPNRAAIRWQITFYCADITQKCHLQ